MAQYIKEALQQGYIHPSTLPASGCPWHPLVEPPLLPTGEVSSTAEVNFLGYVICEGSIRMQPGKVEAVTSWPRPQNRRELQRFLGFAEVHHRFIDSFSTIAKPLTDLLRGLSKRIKWNPEAERSFTELKAAFSTAPVLQQPDLMEPFVVEIDVSNVGVGAVLSQHKGEARQLKPIAYFSKKLSAAERNYGMGDRELLAMKLAFEEWRHWLEGVRHPFLVITDHKNLEYLQTTKRLNSRQSQRLLFFTRFAFCMTYRPGAKNVRADALLRQHHA
ncbi:hypothetical protein P4O66_004305 [Electrophorus voltai]|uniref:Reverse transcriptase/retrotransposon-derived protein RNase H-like domain-containing protein n=1 Tax=Electrophorus voltai TaxID=2609070 RepID=A0AAD9E367_9TELE|nr:hypothetical protein P4O66_004305 [Electrophorus voltai]